ncbi:hypothetical protein EI94DRAFT_1704701 [Lactarius quietus]|nr:hypothetical protein EI94DRAFT_1704701 [Lactarius quietus]
MDHYDIFREQLAIRFPRYGHALWEPSPGGLYHVVGVGDVGHISEGRFHRLFSILLPANDPSHANFGVPVTIKSLSPMSQIISYLGYFVPTTFARPESTWRQKMCIMGNLPQGWQNAKRPWGGFVFVQRETRSNMSLPIPARREDTVVRKDFGKWMIQHIDQWFAWARAKGFQIDRMEDIILVTGTDRTRSWANVAFLGDQADAQVSFGVEVVHSRINWQFSPERKKGAVWNWRPMGRLKAAAGPNPDPKDDDCEPDAEIPAVPKYRDPLHVILDYIAEERRDCDMVIVHDDELAVLDALGDGASLEALHKM